MNRGAASTETPKSHHEQRLWTQPLQVPSRSGNDVQETAILSSIQSLDHGSRLKRSRGRPSEEENATSQSEHSPTVPPPSKPVFQVQSLSLDRGAVAPGLARPTAPFAKSERKKAYVSAIYYSECFLRGIQPKEADTAAFHIQNQYTKWWVQSTKQASRGGGDTKKKSAKKKRRKMELEESQAEAEQVTPSPESSLSPTSWDAEVVVLLKDRLVEHLQKTGGDTTTTEFQGCLDQLKLVYASQQKQQQMEPGNSSANGTWLTLSKPAYSECLGRNEDGEYMYTLGRMSFDMFRPTNLRCSIRAVMNNIRVMDPRSKPRSFPKRLGKQLLQQHPLDGGNPIRHYDIVVAFTVQPQQTLQGVLNNDRETAVTKEDFVIPRPIRGLMTNHGYTVTDPTSPNGNRCSIWFSGGSIEVQDEVADGDVWKQIFDESLAPRPDVKASANLLAAKLLLGAYTTSSSPNTATGEVDSSSDSDEDVVPTMSYFFKRPIGGHGEVYCDTLYMDDTLKIMQGHHGSIFVFTRVPNFQEQPAQEAAL